MRILCQIGGRHIDMLSRRLTRCGYSVRVQTLILRAKRDKDTVSGRLNKEKNTVSKE